MLQSIRSGITGWKAIAILILIGLTFMFFGVGGGGMTVNDWAAKVNGQKVPMQEFRQQLQRAEAQYSQYFPDGIPDETRSQLRENILDGLVRDSLVTQRVQDKRYRISSEAILESTKEIPTFQLDGKFDRRVFKQELEVRGLTEAAWADRSRRQLQVQQFRDAVANSAFVTKVDLEKRQQLQNEERVISYAVVPAAKFKAEVTVTDEDIAAKYESDKANLFTEQEVDIEYIELKTEDLAKDIVIDSQELSDYYSEVEIRYGEPEQRSARKG